MLSVCSKTIIPEYHRNKPLFFLHLPKTGGTTFRHMLARRFNPNSMIQITSNLDLSKINDEPRIYWCHGNYTLMHNRLPAGTQLITLLREPVSRTISLYYFARRAKSCTWHAPLHQHKADLNMFVTHPATSHEIVNPQTHRLAAETRPPEEERYSLERLRLAKKHLNECLFFGLQERFEESMELFAHTFGVPAFKTIDRKLENPDRSVSKKVDSTTLKEIISRTRLDDELYRYAESLFEARLEHFRNSGAKFA